MAKIKRTPRRPPETQPARKQPEKQPRSSAPLPALATDDSPSRRTRSFAASNEETAIHDNSFHSDPGQDEIIYSDNESNTPITQMMLRRPMGMARMMMNMKTHTMRRRTLTTQTMMTITRTIILNWWIVPCWKMRSSLYHIVLIG